VGVTKDDHAGQQYYTRLLRAVAAAEKQSGGRGARARARARAGAEKREAVTVTTTTSRRPGTTTKRKTFSDHMKQIDKDLHRSGLPACLPACL